MNDQMYVVIVDTRAMSPHNIDGYTEHRCSHEFFDENIIRKPRVKCIKSKVGEMCGLDMKLYFHDYTHHHARILQDPPEIAITNEQRELSPNHRINGAATLLTFDPRTGFPEYKILGTAYVVVDSGDYPLSNHQVWGISDLISEARDFYYCDPDHLHRGRRQLLRWCIAYRHQEWGPMTIYEPRVELETLHTTDYLPSRDVQQESRNHIKEVHEYYSHRHFPNCACRKCKNARQKVKYFPGISSPCTSGISSTDNGSNGSIKDTRKEESTIPRRWTLFPRVGLGICNTE